LSCSPAPCSLPTSDVSPGKANTPVIASSPSNSRQLLAVRTDYSCGFLLGTSSSGDGGTTWTHLCLEGFESSGDAALAYGDAAAYVAAPDPTGFWATFLVNSSDNGATWSSPV